jgi:hypothetical protein
LSSLTGTCAAVQEESRYRFMLIILAHLLLSILFRSLFFPIVWREETTDHFYSKASRQVEHGRN